MASENDHGRLAVRRRVGAVGALLGVLVLPGVMAAAVPATPVAPSLSPALAAAAVSEPPSVIGVTYAPRPPLPAPAAPGEAGFEACFGQSRLGGTLRVFVANRDAKAVQITGVVLDGMSLPARPAGDSPLSPCGASRTPWISAPSEIGPNTIAAVSIGADMLREGTSPKIVIKTSGGDLTTQPTLSTGVAQVTDLVFPAGRTHAVAYLTARGTAEITAVRVNGVERKWTGSRVLRDDTPARLELPGRWPAGTPFLLEVELAGAPSVFAYRRVVGDHFLNAMGLDQGSGADPGDMDAIVAAGFNALTGWGFENDLSYVFGVARRHGLGLVPEEFIEAQRGNPRVWAWVAVDEPELPPAIGPNGMTPQEVVDRVQQWQKRDPTRPISVNNNILTSLNVYSPISDIPGWDHYPYAADLTNLPIGQAADFADAMRANAAPAPYWFWSQIDGTWSRPFGSPNPGQRTQSAEDSRLYSLLALGHGTKGIRWYVFNDKSAPGPQWPEIVFQTRLLNLIGQDLLTGASTQKLATSSAAKLDLSSVVSRDAAYLVAGNLDYNQLTNPTTYTNRSGVKIDWHMPPWMAGRTLGLAEVSGQGIRRLGTFRDHTAIETDIKSANLIIAMPPTRLRQLERCFGNGPYIGGLAPRPNDVRLPHRIRLDQLGRLRLGFTLDAPARVTITLRKHGRPQAQQTISAEPGTTTLTLGRRLSRANLTAGRYAISINAHASRACPSTPVWRSLELANRPGGNQPGGNQPGGSQPGGNQPGGSADDPGPGQTPAAGPDDGDNGLLPDAGGPRLRLAVAAALLLAMGAWVIRRSRRTTT